MFILNLNNDMSHDKMPYLNVIFGLSVLEFSFTLFYLRKRGLTIKTTLARPL